MEEFFERLNNFHKKYFRFVLMLALILTVIICLRFLPFVVALMLPFLIAYIISLVAAPLVKFLKNRLKVPYKVGAMITVLLLLMVFVVLVILIIGLVSDLSVILVDNFDYIYNQAESYIKSAIYKVDKWSESLPFDFVDVLYQAFGGFDFGNKGELSQDILPNLTYWLKPFAGSFASGTITIVKSLPEALVFIVMLILATYFFTGQRDKIGQFYREKTSINFQNKLHLIKIECFGALFGWIKSQLILSGVTAIELMIGLSIMGVGHPFFIAILIAIVDMLPVLGTGTVLIPWALISLLTGESIYFCIGMIIIYFVCLSVRNLLQPKILSDNIGLNPLITLIAIWIGYKLYGFLGMIIVPIAVMLIYKLYEIGIFDWFFLSHKKKGEDIE